VVMYFRGGNVVWLVFSGFVATSPLPIRTLMTIARLKSDAAAMSLVRPVCVCRDRIRTNSSLLQCRIQHPRDDEFLRAVSLKSRPSSPRPPMGPVRWMRRRQAGRPLSWPPPQRLSQFPQEQECTSVHWLRRPRPSPAPTACPS
jgi:hypothetical protein